MFLISFTARSGSSLYNSQDDSVWCLWNVLKKLKEVDAVWINPFSERTHRNLVCQQWCYSCKPLRIRGGGEKNQMWSVKLHVKFLQLWFISSSLSMSLFWIILIPGRIFCLQTQLSKVPSKWVPYLKPVILIWNSLMLGRRDGKWICVSIVKTTLL